MNKKILHWLWSLAPMLIVATIALGAWLWLQQNNPIPKTSPTVKQHVPDHQIKGLQLDIVTAKQDRYFRLDAQEAKRMEDTGEIIVSTPKLQAYEKNTPPLSLQSEHANVSNDQKQIDLKGNVTLTRPVTTQTQEQFLPAFQITTQSLQVFTQEATYHSPTPIIAKTSQSELSAQSGIYNQDQGLLELKGRVRGKLGGDLRIVDDRQKN